MKKLLNNIVTALVDNPADVNITESSEGNSLAFELRVHSDDVGKVIGKKGRTINAIRTVLKAVTLDKDTKVMLELLQ
ncbi:KH domain-containing protein [bacterium]|nr:KH domain-containing protein [bacterium]